MGPSQFTKVKVRKGRAKPLFCRHPWVFSGAVQEIEGDFQAGDIVQVVDSDGRFIGRGYINADSRILIRLLSWDENEQIDADFWRRRIAAAIEMRTSVLGLPATTNACRLVFSEGDRLPGLIVDRYAQRLVVQFLTAGAAAWREPILGILSDLCTPTSIVERADSTFQDIEAASPGGLLRGEEIAAPVEIGENGLRFLVDVNNGQKTGFYLDQRDNRLAAARFMAGKSVLDGFAYTGAFSIYAEKIGHAARAVAIESSEASVELGRQNAALNGASNIEFRHGDVSNEIRAIKEAGERFGVVVLDPPKFARTRAGVPKAGKKYRETNLLAMQVLEPGGILITCSCSQHITEDIFSRLLNEAAREIGREVQVLESRTQAADHPVSTACPETKYLTCLICRVL